MDIHYIDRRTKEKKKEKVYGQKALLFLYGDGFFQRAFSFLLLPLLAQFSLASRLYGCLQKRKSSQKKIAPFIEAYGIDKTEFLTSDFRSFNDFFIRKLKPESRPVVSDQNLLAAPADGRYFVYPHFSEFRVKGVQFSLFEFLKNSSYTSHYREGSMVIARLCPSDYHRFHFPCDGIASKPELINGALFSVNPIALQKRLSIFSENKRVITEIESPQFGTVLYIEIGATAVGSIRQTFTPFLKVQKGEEKGYFEFGGSCIVLFFEKGKIQFDEDLIQNTKRGLETLCHYGESLGKTTHLYQT